ncbi:hypothetical protein FGB62_19g135 [Gracilaria domingensis]|nr:hypothetical protein FGB62_19g135 [Gracilaria domingensis]
MPANNKSWISEGGLTRERLLKAVLNSGHSVLDASTLVDSCLRENGSNQRAVLEWLSYLRWAKCKAGFAVCYEEEFGKLRIDSNGSLVQESELRSLRSLLSFFTSSVKEEGDLEKCKQRKSKSDDLERTVLASGSQSARRFIDQRNFVFASRNRMHYARGSLEYYERRSALLLSLIGLTGAAKLDPWFVEVIVPNTVGNVYAIPPEDPEGNGNIWTASDLCPSKDRMISLFPTRPRSGYNISGARVFYGSQFMSS